VYLESLRCRANHLTKLRSNLTKKVRDLVRTCRSTAPSGGQQCRNFRQFLYPAASLEIIASSGSCCKQETHSCGVPKISTMDWSSLLLWREQYFAFASSRLAIVLGALLYLSRFNAGHCPSCQSLNSVIRNKVRHNAINYNASLILKRSYTWGA